MTGGRKSKKETSGSETALADKPKPRARGRSKKTDTDLNIVEASDSSNCHLKLQEQENTHFPRSSPEYPTSAKTLSRPVISETVSATSNSVVNSFKEYVPDDNHLLEMRTLAGNTFKNLLDTLKAVLNDANIVFTDRGLKLASVDSNKHALVHLFMEAASFEFYHCKQKLVLGIDIESLHRTIKTNKLNDLMCFIVRKDNPGYLEVSFENFLKGTKVSDSIKLLSLKEYNIYDKIEYKMPPEMDSQSFQNICREMASFQASLLEIKSIGDELIFTNLNGTTRRQVVVRVSNGDEVNQSPYNASRWNNKTESPSTGEDARGVFLLRFLKSFAKAASLSPRVRIYLKNESPLICEYSVAGLGTLKYVLSSADEEDA